MRNNIFLDTGILVFGIQKNGRNNQEHMVKRAEAFFEKIDQDKDCYPMISAIVLSELLINVPPEEHNKVLAEVEKLFKIKTFDTKSAIIAAQILHEKTIRDGKSLTELCRENGISRDHLKIDCMIIANAKSNNATVLYTEDKQAIKFSEGIVPTASLPEILQQKSLLDGYESEGDDDSE